MSAVALPPLPVGIPVGGPARRRPLPSLPSRSPAPVPPPDPSPRDLAPLATDSGERPPLAPNRPRLDPLPQPVADIPTADFDDAQLAAALRPLVGAASMPDADEFERLIRAAFRRTLAEHSGGPFDAPDLLRRAVWRLDALFSSRSYEETVDEKMRRFRLEEIYLIDRRTLGLVSFASVNPSRHADARKVQAASGRLAALLAALDPDEEHELHYSRKIRALVRPGRFTLLAALVRGRPDPLAGEDLDYALRRIESRFSRPLAEGDPLLQEIQPLLEECLLIHSPPASIPN